MDIPNATNASLQVPNVDFTNSGQYLVVISNDFGSVTSAPVNLDITTSGPIISAIASNKSGPVGWSASLFVNADGSRPLCYQWQFYGTNVALATNSTLVINNMQPSDAGPYRVIVSNAFNTVVTSDVSLTIVPVQLSFQSTTNFLRIEINGIPPDASKVFIYTSTNLVDWRQEHSGTFFSHYFDSPAGSRPRRFYRAEIRR